MNLWFFALPSMLIIAYFDYLLMSKYWRCEKCGYKLGKWNSWLIPTMLEMLLFVLGLYIGSKGLL